MSGNILWASDYCFLRSAYATQSLNTFKWLNGDDRDISVDHQPLSGNRQVLFEPDTVTDYRIWPGETAASGQQFDGSDTIRHFYKGDYDLLVSLKDCLGWFPSMHTSPIPKVAYTPVASDPAPLSLFDAADQWTDVWCPSRNGVEQFDDHGIDATYVPHSVDKSVFRPVMPDDPVDIDDIRSEAGIDPSDYIVGFVGLNRGERKDVARIIEAFAAWRDDYGRSEAKLYMHTDPDGSKMGGVNVKQLAARIGLPRQTLMFTDSWKRHVGYTSRGMSKFYNVIDCYVGTERGAGFSMPLLEASACGTPVIGTRHAAMPERVKHGDNGYLVDPTVTETNQMTGVNAIPSVDDIALALEQVYQNDWDPESVRSTVIPEFDVETVVEGTMLPAIEDVLESVYVDGHRPGVVV